MDLCERPPPRRLILHAGLAKTGTTTLQASLAAQRSDLTRLGVAYPGRDDAHHDLIADLHQMGGGHFWFANRGLSQARAARAAATQWAAVDRCARDGASVILVSSEYFQSLSRERLIALDARVAEIGYELHLFAYIRAPLEHLASRVQQAVKMGSARARDMLRAPYQPWAMALARRSLAALGRRRVQFRKMEDAFAHGHGLTWDLLHQIGAAPRPGQITDLRRNTGLSGAAVYALDALNGWDVAQKGGRHLAAEHMAQLEKITGPRFCLPPEIAARIIAEAAEEQAVLQNRLGLSYPLPAPDDLPEGDDLETCIARGEALARSLSRKSRGAAGSDQRQPERSM